jgi:hypothetical protein
VPLGDPCRGHPQGQARATSLSDGWRREFENRAFFPAPYLLLGSSPKSTNFKVRSTMFEREDWTLFRSLNTLGQKAGVPVERIPRLVAKELADNSLDACGRCRVGLLPENGFWVEDDGEGIPGEDDQIATLFSINRPLTSSKILRRPSRRALGNGLRVVVGAVLATDGRLVVSTRGRSLELTPREDTGETVARRVADWEKGGCRIEVQFGTSVRVNSRTLDWAEDAILMARGESSYTGRSSPHWYDSDAFYELLQASGSRTVRDLIAELNGCAEPKAGQIAEGFQKRFARDLTRDEADQLLAAARRRAKPVKASSLGRVGQQTWLPPGYAKLEASLKTGSPRSAIKAEVPVVLEVWAKTAVKTHARLFVNRTPSTGQLTAWTQGTALYIEGCGCDGYFEITSGRQPIELWINIETPYMPITTDGKEPNILPFVNLIRGAGEKAIRSARRKGSSAPEARQTKKDLILDNLKDAIATSSGDGQFRFSQRQLFYAIRPRFIEEMDSEPDFGYFCQVLTDFEAERGDIPGMYRGPRGVIYHPHLGQEIPLGTLHVEDYRRPAWLFNKVLYCEKEGFFSILRAVNWPERNDCALISSKGFSSRAARDFIDLLAETGEECQFFCIHNADASGTMIYQTLQQATRARGARKVRIVNLGLEPAEAREMGLQEEQVKKKQEGRDLAVADYVPPDDRLWLQSHRVELNAMTTPQFLEWLDRKFEPYRGKVVPPTDVLLARLEQEIREALRQRYTRIILRRQKLHGRIERAVERRAEAIATAAGTLPDEIRRALEHNQTDLWTHPVDRLAREISRTKRHARVEG